MKQTLLLLTCIFLASCSGGTPVKEMNGTRVVILGFDGFDPDWVQEWLGDLPNIQRLSRSGTLTRLATTNPPESPVAWASFATGLNPGKHGIFDFLRRDPATYLPEIGLSRVEEPRSLLGLVKLGGPKVINYRKGIPYWKQLDNAGIPTTNLRVPLEFPATGLEVGKTWAGLGVPDIRGTWGSFFYLASDLTEWDLVDSEFGGRMLRLEAGDDNRFSTILDGPVDPEDDGSNRMEIPVEFQLVQNSTAVAISIQGQDETVKEGEWSPWFRFEFKKGSAAAGRGISRFKVLETFPELRLYLLPISLDPVDPGLPICYPDDYLSSLVNESGYFKTLGWMHETWGLNEERIDEADFLEDLFRNVDDLERILLESLKEGDSTVYTAVFTAPDSVSHMFYRLIDPEHPRYETALAEKYSQTILRVYQRMDSIIAKVLEHLDDDDLLLVVSDHGFHSWRKEFNTNTWLARNGFLAFKEEGTSSPSAAAFSGGSFFPNVDWSRTEAYALGLGQIYINLQGREAQGIVEPGEDYRQVVAKIRDQIAQFTDPDTGQKVIQNTYARDEIFKGDQLEYAGDIQLSFVDGYRTSWQTSLGAVPPDVVVANLKKWSGDHAASDPSDTEGFLLSNRRITSPNPSILDVAPTLYRIFELQVPDLDGTPWAWE